MIMIDEVDLMDCMTGIGNWGICLGCGELNDGCEPDMRNGECEVCEASKVYGLEEAVLMGIPIRYESEE